MWPEFSAVRDAGDTFNTGLFVLEPSLATYDNMIKQYMDSPSYNQGDQGFLNWYFRNSVKMALPLKYNTVCKHKVLRRIAVLSSFSLESSCLAIAEDDYKDDPLHK